MPIGALESFAASLQQTIAILTTWRGCPTPGDRHERAANCKLIGRWRIVEADILGCGISTCAGPAMTTITGHDRGEIAFGAFQAGLDIEYRRSSVKFTWEVFDEMDEVSRDGSERNDDGSIEIEFAYLLGRSDHLTI